MADNFRNLIIVEEYRVHSPKMMCRLFLNYLFSSITFLAFTSVSYAQVPNCVNYTAPDNGSYGSGGRTVLTWTASTSGSASTGYKLYFGTDPSLITGNIVNGTNLGNVLSYNASSLTCNTTYYWKIVPTNGSGDATGCTIRSFIIVPPPSPLTTSFGNNSWTTFVYNTTGFTGYSGYYTNTGTPSFNSTTIWNLNESPSGTTISNNYKGCRVSNDNFSYISKRQGFPPGIYKLEVQNDDQGTLLVNGTQVYQQNYMSTLQNAWMGYLDESSTVEFRIVENGGGSNDIIQFSPIMLAGTIGSNQSVCTGGDPDAFTSIFDAVSDAAGVTNCFRSPGAITVDGNLSETGWSIYKPISKTVVGSTSNNTATFGVLWDNTNLYVGIKVLDASLNMNNSSGSFWDGDGVEIYLDPNNNKSGAYEGLDNQLIINQENLFQKITISGLQHAWTSITGGYSVEFAIPWSQLSISPVTGVSIGFDVGNK